MKENHHILYLSMGLSLVVHVALGSPLVLKEWGREDVRHYPVATLVSVQIASRSPMESVAPKIEPLEKTPAKVLPKKHKKKEPKPKGKSIHKTKRRRYIQPDKQKEKTPDNLPVPNKKTNKDLAGKETPKPVFGVTRESVRQDGDSAVAVRVGNTLMKNGEEAFTPADKVKAYHAIPPFELSRLPLYKIKVTPEYPESLKAAEKEGEVLLAVTIDDQGKVVAMVVKRSDDLLFAKAAKAALKKCEFTPGMQNGMPVTTIIDVPIKFILDE
jgi:periplasmic protein TonB